MSSPFPVHVPEQAFTRRVLFAAEILDAVTLETVTRGLKVTAIGMKNKPLVNCEGFFVWLEEDNAQPQQVIIDASGTPYESITLPAPALPARLLRLELAPRYEYPFGPGTTALRGTLVESFPDNPAPVEGSEVWLQWIDDTAAGTIWVDAPTHSHSNPAGDFAAHLRLTPQQIPRAAAGGGLSGRLKVDRQGVTRTSAEISLPSGRVAEMLSPFGWNELAP